ncbi:ABC transporter ATP-binding protein [Dehalobacter sp. TBBPA1]|uniref:ABC transporter ATP-binding protein n=1 Tax=Dehalobacter sp. TBBPA1 TaxID=3235037 RepID=UPI0034A24896
MEPAVQLKIESLVFPPETNKVLKDIDLTINQGDFIAITGEAASGKSMLLHSITGAASQFFNGQLNGTVRVMGQDIHAIPLAKMCDYIGYMMQEPQNQMVSITVEEEVAFGIANMELPWDEMKNRVKKTLQFVGLEGFEQRKTDGLSGGQAQRVVLASILAMETPILVLDQPTAELDGKGKRELYSYISYLNKEKGITVIMVMDRACDILPYTNRILIMAEGTIREECSPGDYQKRFNQTRPTPNMTAANEKLNEKLNEKSNQKSNEKLMEVKDLAFTYKGGFKGCENMNLDINCGDFIGVIGLNGSGKTTLLKLMEGLLIPDTGAIRIFGKPLTKRNLATIRSQIGFLFQNPDLQIFANTVKDEAAFVLRTRKLPEEEIAEKVNGILDKVGLLAFADVHPHRLSRCQRQKLAIASVLVGGPEIIMADEPTSGLDEEQSALIMELLSAFQQQGKTVILVTHDLGLAKQYANRIVAMHMHRLALDIPAQEIGSFEEVLKDIGLDFQKEGVAYGFH